MSLLADPVIRQLRSRIRHLEHPGHEGSSFVCYPGLGKVLPGRSLRRGSSYTVLGSTSLAMAMLAGPSIAGAWCAVLGAPNFGLEAADQLGIKLGRLVLVPHPGETWLAVAAALIDVMDAVLLVPSGDAAGPSRISAAEASRLAARLRKRGCLLICQQPSPFSVHPEGSRTPAADAVWPQSEAVLIAKQCQWEGLKAGHGQLRCRELSVQAHWRSGRERRTRIHFPPPRAGSKPGVRTLPSEPGASRGDDARLRTLPPSWRSPRLPAAVNL